jgi:hypothetical protein
MRVTEKKTVKIERSCKRNPVYVTWLDRLGGRNYWLFHTSQVDAVNTSSDATFEPFTPDLEASRGQIIDLAIFAQPTLSCTALIDTIDASGFQTLYYSLNIEVLTNPDTWTANDLKWKTYRPQKGSFVIRETNQTQSLVEITFETPYINNQIQ